jgi:recombination protein RecR
MFLLQLVLQRVNLLFLPPFLKGGMMSSMEYPKPIEHLIEQLRKLPSIGYKSAERLAFSLIDWKEKELSDLSDALVDIKRSLSFCNDCGAMLHQTNCRYCSEQRDSSCLCVVANAKDIYLFEQTGEFRGLYHVLGNLLSPIAQKTPPQERIDALKQRIENREVKEVILAMDATLEGDATALYIQKELTQLGIPVSRLALGIPMGSSLDYIDGGTLARAFAGRRILS